MREFERAAHFYQSNCFRVIIFFYLQHLPFLQTHYSRLTEILEEWREYKQSVPTYGAALLSENNTHVLLVQSYWAKSSWGFPKGKVNEDEDPAHCAIREVYEETGFDISDRIDPSFYFESVINEQLVRLYVITGISMETKFQPRTRYEIKACEWFPIIDLPNSKKDLTPKVKMGVNPNSFYMVLPFVRRLKGLCCNSEKGKRRNRAKSCCNFTQVEEQSKEVTKHCSKRQLFGEEEEEEKIVFCAPSWLNFKFDRTAIMECIY